MNAFTSAQSVGLIPVTVSKIEQITPDTRVLTLTAPGGQHLPGFSGGSHVTVVIPAEGGTLAAFTIPALTRLPEAVRGRVPPIARVIGLDTEYDYLFLRTPTNEVIGVDLASGRVDTVAREVERATLGPDGTLYTVDTKRRVTTLKRRVR